MTILKCDRCGNTYKLNDFYISQLKYYFNESPSSEETFNGEYYDLCPECTKKVIDFINNKATFKLIDVNGPIIFL